MTDMQRPEREQDVQAAASAGTSNQPSTSTDDAISRRRRGLLKAAASAAPFIATLPSGEALAAASAPHCVINRQNGRDTPSPVVFDPVPPEDHYIRIPGSVQDYLIFDPSVGFGPITVFHLTIGATPLRSSATIRRIPAPRRVAPGLTPFFSQIQSTLRNRPSFFIFTTRQSSRSRIQKPMSLLELTVSQATAIYQARAGRQGARRNRLLASTPLRSKRSRRLSRGISP
jgi:hypothetical protein